MINYITYGCWLATKNAVVIRLLESFLKVLSAKLGEANFLTSVDSL